jgi:hypothetical protein
VIRALWALVLAVPLSALAQGSGVDWQRQVLRVTGRGPPDVRASNRSQARSGAERSARADALEALKEQAKGMRLRADRTVGEELAREEVRARVEEVLRGFKVVRKRYYSDSGVELEVEVPLGALTLALVSPAPAASAAEVGAGKKSPSSSGKPSRKVRYTGVVVDARALGMTPMLAPRLVDEAGQVLHGAERLSTEGRAPQGVAGFFTGLEEAKASQRVGEQPLVISPARLQGSDLVLGQADRQALEEVDPEVLAEGRVAILTQ